MNRSQIREIMLAHGFTIKPGHDDLKEYVYQAAEALISAEREACAKTCEDAISSIWEFHPEYVNQVGKNVCKNLAKSIRARGQQ